MIGVVGTVVIEIRMRGFNRKAKAKFSFRKLNFFFVWGTLRAPSHRLLELVVPVVLLVLLVLLILVVTLSGCARGRIAKNTVAWPRLGRAMVSEGADAHASVYGSGVGVVVLVSPCSGVALEGARASVATMARSPTSVGQPKA